MKLGLVEGVASHQMDAEIVKAIADALQEHGGGSDSIIAVKNEGGKVYRLFTINGLQQEIPASTSSRPWLKPHEVFAENAKTSLVRD